MFSQCVQELAGERVWIVGVHCSLEALARREQARGDRQARLAKAQHAEIHRGVRYDLEVDTTYANVMETALEIKTKLETLGSPSAVATLNST